MDNPLIIEGNGTETNPWADTVIDNLDSYAKFEKMFNDLMYQDPQMWDERVYEPIYGGFETQKVKLHFSNFSEKQQREIIKGIIDKLKAQGYDGIIIKNTRVDSLNPDEGINQYVVFEPNQIKSVYNRGTWNARNDNIYYQGQIADNVIDGHEVIDGFDENASNDAFVRTKEGRVEHGYITDELAKQIGSSKGGEIRLYNDLDKHIDKGRKKYILSQGYEDLIDFVDDTISNWEKIYKGSDESFLITKSKNKDNIVAVKLERDGKYYKVSTALISCKDYLKNKKTLAERAQSNQLLTKSPGAISGTSDIHNIALKEENVKPDYQNKPQPKGLYDASKGVIKIFESVDFSTLPHEIAHYWLDNLWSYVRSGNASEKYRQRWNVIAKGQGLSIWSGLLD